MNDTTPPPGASGPAGSDPGASSQNGAPPLGDGFFAWLRRLGIVRSQDRWFAGAAGGIAARAGVDPLIVRGLFVVLALLGGPGLLLYLAGWLLLPDSSGRIHAEEVVRGRASAGMMIAAAVIAGVVIIPVFVGLLLGNAPLLGTPGFWAWDLWGALGLPLWLIRTATWLFWIAVVVAGFFLIRHFVLLRGRERAAASEPGSASDADAPGAAGPGTAESRNAGSGAPAPGARAADAAAPSDASAPFTARAAEQANEWGERTSRKAAEWGAEVGRQADEWSARYAEHCEARKLGAAQTVFTLALALLAGGVVLFWSISTGLSRGGEDVDPALPWVLASVAMLAVLGLSAIVAGVRGRGTGWVGFLSACGVVALLFTAVLPMGTRFHPFGDARVSGAHDAGAVMIAGDAHIDLRDLDDDRRSSEEEIVVWQLAGSATIALPDHHPVSVRIGVLAGNISDSSAAHDGFRVSGPFLRHDAGSRSGSPAGTADASTGDPTRVTVYLLAGDVRVIGGDAGSGRERERGPHEDDIDPTEKEPAR